MPRTFLQRKKYLKLAQCLKVIGAIFLLFVGWRLAMIAVLYIAHFKIPLNDLAAKPTQDFWDFSQNYDAGNFIDIARVGYNKVTAAFFPGFPLLIFAAAKLFHTTKLAVVSLVLANILTLGAMVQMYRYAKLTSDDETAWESMVLMIAFPFSIFLALGYSEPLFLFAAISSFLMVKKGKFIEAGIFGAVAGATRLVGTVLIIPLLIEAIIYAVKHRSYFRPLGVFLALGGIIGVGLYYRHVLGDPLAWLHSYGPTTWNRSIGLGAFYNLKSDLIIIFHKVNMNNDTFILPWTEVFAVSFALFGTIVLAFQKKWSELVFVVLGMAVILSSGSLVSINRYVISFFPLFIATASLTKKVKYLIAFLFLPLAGLYMAMFSKGWWVG